MFYEKIINKIGYVETTIPNIYFNDLMKIVKNHNFDEDYNKDLAGQIEDEKKFNVDLLPNPISNIIFEGCINYINTFDFNIPFLKLGDRFDFEIASSWINFQKKGEYNPIHRHFGGELVFVIWLQIPYELQDELNHPSCVNSNNRCASMFEFANIPQTFNSKTHTIIPVDKSYEGKMIIFESSMNHTVYPFFTSDDYRISMSGNVKLVPANVTMSNEEAVKVVIKE
jgi:hypothetical protein